MEYNARRNLTWPAHERQHQASADLSSRVGVVGQERHGGGNTVKDLEHMRMSAPQLPLHPKSNQLWPTYHEVPLEHGLRSSSSRTNGGLVGDRRQLRPRKALAANRSMSSINKKRQRTRQLTLPCIPPYSNNSNTHKRCSVLCRDNMHAYKETIPDVCVQCEGARQPRGGLLQRVGDRKGRKKNSGPTDTFPRHHAVQHK